MSFRRVRRRGCYYRVADPAWRDPLDGHHAARAGGRWNPPGSFPTVYLNASVATARANVAVRFRGQPFTPEDLDPATAPVLVSTDVPPDRFADVVSDAGCAAAGLPKTYPLARGRTVPRTRCQPIGQRAWDRGLPGIACRSAAPGAARTDEELAWFQRSRRLVAGETVGFEDWFWGAAPS